MPRAAILGVNRQHGQSAGCSHERDGGAGF
jgi:hypothetical protein